MARSFTLRYGLVRLFWQGGVGQGKVTRGPVGRGSVRLLCSGKSGRRKARRGKARLLWLGGFRSVIFSSVLVRLFRYVAAGFGGFRHVSGRVWFGEVRLLCFASVRSVALRCGWYV